MPNGYTLYQDSERVVIATTHSENSKTGDMIQVWILAAAASPIDAVRTGLDEVICGHCPMRSPDGHGWDDRLCYVNVAQGPNSVWQAWRRGNYEYLPLSRYAEVFTDRAVRFGAYGDPVHIPLDVVRKIIFLAGKTTGYTHQWRETAYQPYAEYFMASVETSTGMAEAIAQNWRTFRVRTANETLLPNEVTCPASAEAGHRTQCEACGLCGGARVAAKSVAIMAHGIGANKLVQLGAN